MRRPADLLRFLTAQLVVIAILVVSTLALQTGAALKVDVLALAGRAPALQSLAQLLGGVVGIAFLVLPVAMAVDQFVRRQPRVVVEALLASVLASLVAFAAQSLLRQLPESRLVLALSASVVNGRLLPTLPAVFAAAPAFYTVCRLEGRPRWLFAVWVTMGGSLIATLGSQTATIPALAALVVSGWGIGALIRYGFGSPPSMPLGAEVAASLARAGVNLVRMRLVLPVEPRDRRYRALDSQGRDLDVVVVHQDGLEAGALYRIWRSVRLQEEVVRGQDRTVREALQRRTLLAFAAEHSGARVPTAFASVEVGPGAGVIALEHINGEPLGRLAPEELTDEILREVWTQLETLHGARVVHRSITSESILVNNDGSVALQAPVTGEIAATDLQLRLDTAQTLCTLALLVGSPRALAAADAIVGEQRINEVLPVLQPVAMSQQVRRELRADKAVLTELRESLLARLPANPAPADTTVNLERLRPRTILTAALGTIAAYLLINQLANVDLGQLLRTADYKWVSVAMLLSAVTFFGAALVMVGFVPGHLRYRGLLLSELAGAFVRVVTPAGVGGIAVPMQYVQKAGVESAVAVASVGVSQIFVLAVHLTILLIVAVVAGTSPQTAFNPPTEVLVVVVLVAALLVIAATLPRGRKLLREKVWPLISRVTPRLLEVFQTPTRLATGLGGAALLTLANCAALYASVEAFGGGIPVATVFLVFLVGFAIGSAAPTPGGVGGVEAVLAAGLTAAGTSGGVALSAVLLFRLATFWFPMVPGYISFNYLTRSGRL